MLRACLPATGCADRRLYQLPLDEFTAARNALAKASGAAAAEIRALQKPPVAAWAINQVYWRGRPAFHALTAAAAALRAAHTAVVTGKKADLRAAGKAHEDALEAVVKLAIAILRDAGQPATDATRQAIATTLRALPASTDPPGRLTQSSSRRVSSCWRACLRPCRSDRARRRLRPRKEKKPATRSPEKRTPRARRRWRRRRRQWPRLSARSARPNRMRAVRSSKPRARRAMPSAPRAMLAKARKALEAAQEAVEAAERDAEAAARKKEAAARRVRGDRRSR